MKEGILPWKEERVGVKGFMIGLLGAVAGILFAPKSGKNYSQIREK
jgi:gas vesicle protein